MSHNESLADRTLEVVDTKSTLKKVGSYAIVAGMYAIPVALTVGSGYYSVRLMKMNLATAKLNLEAAKAAAKLV